MALVILTLDGDVTAEFDLPASGTHFDDIDEGPASADDGTYIATNTYNDVDEFTLSATPAVVTSVSRVDVNLRGYINDDSETARYEITLWHTGGGSQVGGALYLTGAQLGGYGTTPTTSAVSWTGLSLTKTEADSLQLRVKFLES